jgi:hypothetical protein
MFVRLLLSISLLTTALAQSTDQGVFSASQTAKEGAPGILPDMFKALIGERINTPKISTAELQRIMRRNEATVFDGRPAEEYSTGQMPRPVTVAPRPGRPSGRNIPFPASASQ